MNVLRIAFAPLYLLADWVNDNPISTLGVLIALGALVALFVAAAFGSGVAPSSLVFDSTTAERFAATALERPAYIVAVAVGLAMGFFYDG
ncbi:MAG: hypothetical protein ACQET5_14685 [Halobacteriota archaeon]|uniref:hypothetical protein n=1 Tax=Natronomonas sp. TaxID=2184060 RepID=UPI0039756E2A